LETKWK